MNDVPLFDDLTPPAGQAERIPITVPTREELLSELADISERATLGQWWASQRQYEDLSRFLACVVLVCEQTRAFLGAREP